MKKQVQNFHHPLSMRTTGRRIFNIFQKMFYGGLILLAIPVCVKAQQIDSSKIPKPYKNIIRYNISNALIFGVDGSVVFGYERVLSRHRSFSVNVGKASLPKLVEVATDSFTLEKESSRKGFNVSADYRFYLGKQNKFDAPHGVYFGPYYSYNQFDNTRHWLRKNSSGISNEITSESMFSIHTVGLEMGYQFLLWKRVALDFVMIGPGLGFYKYEATFAGDLASLDPAKKEQLLEALKQILEQKTPGLNYIFSEKKINLDGTLKTSTLGYRCLIHVGFAF